MSAVGSTKPRKGPSDRSTWRERATPQAREQGGPVRGRSGWDQDGPRDGAADREPDGPPLLLLRTPGGPRGRARGRGGGIRPSGCPHGGAPGPDGRRGERRG